MMDSNRGTDDDDDDIQSSSISAFCSTSNISTTKTTTTTTPSKVKMGPEPTLISRKDVETLYGILDATRVALSQLNVRYIVTGGTLLGAIRQHSFLFCDDDIDIAIIDDEEGEKEEQQQQQTNQIRRRRSIYETIVVPNLQRVLGSDYVYQIRPWEGGDRIRHRTKSNVFVDLFVLRRYTTMNQLVEEVLSKKKNQQRQSQSYIDTITTKIQSALEYNYCSQSTTTTTTESILETNESKHHSNHDNEKKNTSTNNERNESNLLLSFWHFSTRKAVEMWPKEVYQPWELFPLTTDLKFGPLVNITGPHTPVILLKRAFGEDCFDVYYQSVSHHNTNNKNNKNPNADNNNSNSNNNNNNSQYKTSQGTFPPLVYAGGTWEASEKQPLEDQHYIPIQPISKIKRRPTFHGREQLHKYLETQSVLERQHEIQQQEDKRINNNPSPNLNENNNLSTSTTCTTDATSTTTRQEILTVYTDGVFDLFHGAHLVAIEKCASLGQRLIVGVTGDEDATSYKRRPIVPQDERCAIVRALKCVDDVICPCPLVVTQSFMEEHNIDLVVHGFANDADVEKQREFFDYPMRVGKFQRIPYTHGVSTTDRILKIQRMVENDQNKESDEGTNNKNDNFSQSKPQWFGTTLAELSDFATTIPTDPFPLTYRHAIESHIDKARIRRHQALDAIRRATGPEIFDQTMASFYKSVGKEFDVTIDRTALERLVRAFRTSTNLSMDVDMSKLHQEYVQDSGCGSTKFLMLQNMTMNPAPFHEAYDTFVRSVCIPHFVSDDDVVVYYQSFPCIRIIQPNEFSIGPHADVSYGHHPCSVNYYVPLTPIDAESSSSSLFLESRPGSEDWHCITQDLTSPTMKVFPGATCLHWTTDNTTTSTRVSLDFRLISADAFTKLKCGGNQTGGQLDVYRNTPGYYSKCVLRKRNDDSGKIWERKGPLLSPPDGRVGFPWTVKNWKSFLKKQGM